MCHYSRILVTVVVLFVSVIVHIFSEGADFQCNCALTTRNHVYIYLCVAFTVFLINCSIMLIGFLSD